MGASLRGVFRCHPLNHPVSFYLRQLSASQHYPGRWVAARRPCRCWTPTRSSAEPISLPALMDTDKYWL